MTAVQRKEQARFFIKVNLEHLNVFIENLRRRTDRSVGTLSSSFEVEGNPDRLTGKKKEGVTKQNKGRQKKKNKLRNRDIKREKRKMERRTERRKTEIREE